MSSTRDPLIKVARVDFPIEAHARVKAAADRLCLPIAAYIRMIVIKEVESDETKRQ